MNKIKILANDGLSAEGIKQLNQAGIEVVTKRVEQQYLIDEINREQYAALLVRSTTDVTRKEIDACPSLKLIARVGAGVDNIDVEYAIDKGIEVISTPLASSPSVAEMVFAHLFSISRSLYDSNRNMPKGNNFIDLKKKYGDGFELAGKTLGIIGFGRIGQEVAKVALGLGMKVIATDQFVREVDIDINIQGISGLTVSLFTSPFDRVLVESDIITMHVPLTDQNPTITKKEIEKMKDGVILINVSRGAVICETDLIDALKSGKIKAAGLDVFNNEPNPREELLKLENVSLSPHMGGATVEAQKRIGNELAQEIISFFKQK